MDKEIVECNLEKSERHPHRNERDPEVIRQRRIIGTNISKEKTSMVRKISTMKQTDQGTRLPRKLKDIHTEMSEIRKLFDNVESLEQIYLKRRLAWFEKYQQ